MDNAEYDDSKNEQAFVEGRILTLERIIDGAILIGDEASHSDKVNLGAHVIVLNQNKAEEEYTIVGSAELTRARDESPTSPLWAKPYLTRKSVRK